MTPAPRPQRWRVLRTLRGRLTVSTIAVLLVACAVLGVATSLFLRAYLIGRLDSELAAAGGRFSISLERGGTISPGGNDGDADNANPGQSVGTVGIRLLRGAVAQAAIVTDDGRNRPLTLDAADTRRLAALPVGGAARTIDLTAYGDYRLQAVAGNDGDVQITGLPLHPVEDTVTRVISIEVAASLVIVVAGAVATTLIVRRTLRPLEQVAATALQVSELPLADPATVLPAPTAPATPHSEAEQVAAAFDHMLDHVRHALTARDATEAGLRRFVADASHELRTPLATIRAYAEFAGRPGEQPLSPATVDALDRITAAADRMATLVADLLLLARLDAGRPLLREPVDVTRLVLDTLTDARTAAPDHHWRLDLPEDAVPATGDDDRLHQVLANLLGNAARHTPAGTTITVSLHSAPDAVEVRVHDDGPGIPLDQQADLFDRFTRGDTSRSREHGSTGLGLAIAHGIATAHHGTLSVRSHPGDTCFTLRLPRFDD